MVAARRWKRCAGILLIMLGTLIGSSSPVAADPPGPTDYRTDVVSLTPTSDAVDVEIIGGDSFVSLTVAAGAAVEVIGYDGEVYLRFDPVGTVWENVASRTHWLNQDRYGDATVPEGVSSDNDPEWNRVGEHGRYAWHDHRAHWMLSSRPPGAEPGDTVLEAVVPLRVNGDEVDVLVRSVLQPPPSRLPQLVALVLSVSVGVAVVLGLSGRHRISGIGWASLLVAAGALAIAWSEYRFVPPETEPQRFPWILPLIALPMAAAALFRGRQAAAAQHPSVFDVQSAGLLAAVGLELVLWAWLRFDGLSAAIVPSPAPDLSRAVTVAALTVGVLAIGVGLDGVRRVLHN